MSDFSWSYSHYSLALQCLRKFKYVAIDKLVATGPDSSDLLFGSALHSAINAVLTGQDGLSVFELYWLSYRDKDVKYSRFNWEQLAELGANFIRKFVKMHAPKYKLEFAESRLYAEYMGVKLEGTLDYLGEYAGRRALRDFKTSSRNYEAEKADCALQLYLYSYLAIQNGFKAPDTLGYTVFNKATGSIQDLTWEFNVNTMNKALDDMAAYCHDRMTPSLQDKDYPRNLNSCMNYNRRCEFYDKCHKEKSE